MKRKGIIQAFPVVCAICIILGLGNAFAAIDIPAKLKDIPLFPGAKVEQALDMENHAMVTAKVNAKLEVVADFYKNTLLGKGWKIFFQAEQDNSRLIHFRKDDRMLQVAVQSEEGEAATTISLVMISQ